MSRVYAKVSIEMWGDDRFTHLSALPPSGQSLWIYLLTGTFRTPIPGLNLNNIGIGALSDRLKWRARDVEHCWAQIEAERMARADWVAGVVWLPKGIVHNEPASPNVVRGWGRVVLPQCALVREALDMLEDYLAKHPRLGRAYVEAFKQTFADVQKGLPQKTPLTSEAFPTKPPLSGEAFRDGSPNQEQEQEQYTLPNPPSAREGSLRVSTRKPSRDERVRAENALRASRNGCPHGGACRSHAECIGRLVQEERERIASGQRAIAGPANAH